MTHPKVGIATNDFFAYFREQFPNLELVTPNHEYDLIIFSGGADVHPSRYGQPVVGGGGFNVSRDEVELSLLDAVVAGDVKCGKVLGVCRGLQLMNVGMGGTLIQDLSHPTVHRIEWTIPNALSWMSVVNSFHHQGIQSLGHRYENLTPILLGSEPESKLPEAVMWGDDYLAVQFHPEFFPNKLREAFFGRIENWVRGIAPIV